MAGNFQKVDAAVCPKRTAAELQAREAAAIPQARAS